VNQWVPLGPPSAPPEPSPTTVKVAFHGERREFLRLISRGARLELISLGFYRFWLATDIRRHLWANTLVAGDAAEYTGRGRELLIGFLFALAILVPVYVAYFLVGLEVERFKTFASFPLFVFFYLFGQFANYRARRYRLTRTVWRGVRFWMDGSGWAYAVRAALWGVLMILTLGLMLPWCQTALERYKMRHCYYGDLQGSFEGRGWEFFKRGWWLWLLPVVLFTGPPTLVDVAAVLEVPLPRSLAQSAPFISLLFLLWSPFVYGAYKAVQWRWWLSGIRFGGVRLESTLPRSALIGLYWKVIGWIVVAGLAFAVYLALAAVLVASMATTPLKEFFALQEYTKSIPLLVLAGLGYLMFALAINVVIRVYLVRDLWVRVLGSTIVHGIEAVANVAARGELANALGEGFADGLDVAGF
jgi:uncharacterized membrane protein YjgN (DUF898 family)